MTPRARACPGAGRVLYHKVVHRRFERASKKAGNSYVAIDRCTVTKCRVGLGVKKMKKLNDGFYSGYNIDIGSWTSSRNSQRCAC